MKHIHSTGWYPVQNYLLPLIIYSYCISFNIAKVTFKNTILSPYIYIYIYIYIWAYIQVPQLKKIP